MASEGMSDPSIAQVTTKTVENQLGRVYQKLGIAGRLELRRALQN
jgi:DNA-binding CsgD family transcriptional regulator